MKKQIFILKNHHQKEKEIEIEAHLEIEEKSIKMEFKVRGVLENYIFPKPSKQQRANELWKGTCFELFFASNKASNYREINISPSTEWNIYQFKAYREFLKIEEDISLPFIKTVQTKELYHLSFECDFHENILEKKLIFNLAVILLDIKGVRSFYTINQKYGEVDFHDKETWKK